jgi:tRNA(Ile)-lysidine synthase
MTRLTDQVEKTIAEHRLLVHGETVVVGVSGGPDSLCLLHLLHRLRDRLRLDLHAAHLDHSLRGGESDGDRRFVQAIAAEWKLPCHVERVDLHHLAREHRLAIEEAGRLARYAFLRRTALDVGALTIAVGHNADDQAETVLMHWLRGSGLAGLRGMLPLTPLTSYRLPVEPDEEPGCGGLRLIRPLLETPRSVIEDYCQRHELEARSDRSNLDTTYFRNWLRHTVLPLLAEHNPNVREVIRRSAQVVAGDYELLRSLLLDTWPRVVLEEAGDRITFDLDAWRELPTSLQRSTVREAVHRLRRTLRNINFVHVENAITVARSGTTGDQSTLPRGLVLTLGYERLSIRDEGAEDVLVDWPLMPAGSAATSVNIPGDTALPGADWLLRTETMSPGDLDGAWESNPDRWRAYLDAAVVGAIAHLRTRKPGDRFRPQGMGGRSVKLGDFLTNQKVLRRLRDRLPLLVGEGGIAWVCGQRIDERARVRDTTRQILVARFVRAGDLEEAPL